MRRLFFVLIRLPSAPAEAEHLPAIVSRQDGYGQLVDHLLDRPKFGERWSWPREAPVLVA